MKKILCFFSLLVLTVLPCGSIETPSPTLQPESGLPNYVYYYNFRINESASAFIVTFKGVSKEDYRNYSKEQKKAYNRYLKINKYISKKKFIKAFDLEPDLLPTHLIFYNYTKAERKPSVLKNIIYLDNSNLLNHNELIVMLASDYYAAKQYYEYIDLINSNKNIFNNEILKPFTTINLVNAYYNVNDYKNAYKYAQLVSKDTTYYNYVLDICYTCAKKLYPNDLVLIKSYAKKLYDLNYPTKYVASVRMAELSTNDNERLKYYNIAKDSSSAIDDKFALIGFIDGILQRKIDNASKSIRGYFDAPNWFKIMEDCGLQGYYVGKDEIVYRYDDYYQSIMKALNYRGEELKKAFEQIIQNEEKQNAYLVSQYREKLRVLQEEERIRQLRMLNINAMEANDLQRQQNYILNRPRNTTTTRYGNTYYSTTY